MFVAITDLLLKLMTMSIPIDGAGGCCSLPPSLLPPTDREERMPLILFPMKNARAKCDDDDDDQNKSNYAQRTTATDHLQIRRERERERDTGEQKCCSLSLHYPHC